MTCEIVARESRYEEGCARGPQFSGGSERLYPLYSLLGVVTALIDEGGHVKERFAYDTQRHITYLDASFNTKAVQQSQYDWEQFMTGMRFDKHTGLHFVGSRYYHADLGRCLPIGGVSVLPERVVNSYVDDFPFGDYRAPPAKSLGTAFDKWLVEQPQWAKCTIGVVLFAAAVAACFVLPGPGWLLAVGLVAGAIAGGVGAAFFSGQETGYGDITLGAGIGALFGALCPVGAIGSLYRSMVGLEVVAIGRLCGCDWLNYSAGWHFGGLVGGLAGGIHQEAVWAAKAGQSRSLVSLAMWGAGPEFLGGGAGAAYGYLKDGTSASALHYASLGMMIVGAGGCGARGLFAVRRAEPRVGPFGSLDLIEDADDEFFKVISQRPLWDVDPDGYFDVTCHGNNRYVRLGKDAIRLTPEDLADILGADPTYKGQDIRLLTCHAAYGEESFAQRLADIMDVKVKASGGWFQGSPDGHHKHYGTMFNHDGTMVLHANTEEILKWVVKKPRRYRR